MRRLAAVVLGAVLALQGAPAQAAKPALYVGLYRPPGAPAGDAIVQLEAPGASWGIRAAARELDAAIDGLTILTTGTCASRPDAACIRVQVAAYTPEQQAALSNHPDHATWAGLVTYGLPYERTVHLDVMGEWGERSRMSKLGIAAHELGHALGLDHHDNARGIMGPYLSLIHI